MITKKRYYLDFGTFMQPLVFDRTTREIVASFECLGYVLNHHGDSKTKNNEKKVFHCFSVPSGIAADIVSKLNSGEIDIDGKPINLEKS